MRIVETELYQFSELSEDAKQKAIEGMVDINVYYEWYDYDGSVKKWRIDNDRIYKRAKRDTI